MIRHIALTTLASACLATTAVAWPEQITVSGATISEVGSQGCLIANKTDGNAISVDLQDMTKYDSDVPPLCYKIGYVNATLTDGDSTCKVSFAGTDLASPNAQLSYNCCGFNDLDINVTLGNPGSPASEVVVTKRATNSCKN